MRRLKLIFLLYILSASFVLAEEPTMSITLDQQKFADSIVKNNPDIVNAAWLSETDLWVETIDPDKNAASKLALEVIKEATYLNQSFCVIVHPGNYIEIAKHCLKQ